MNFRPPFLATSTLAAILALAACSGAEPSADSVVETAPNTMAELPALRAATWAGETWIANVKGTGPGAAKAQAMQGTKAQFQTCVPETSGQEGVARVVSAAFGDSCTLSELSSGKDPGYFKGTLRCDGGTVTFDGMINETAVGGATVRTVTAPDSGEEVIFEINLTSKPGEACNG